MLDWLNGFRIRLTLLFGGLSLVCTLGVTLYINQLATSRITAASGEILHGLGRAIAQSLGQNLDERQKEISILSQTPLFVRGDLAGEDARRSLDRLLKSYPAYAWLGVTDARGRVLSASRDMLLGADVSARPWFVSGRQNGFVGDVHEAVLLAKKLPPNASGEPLRFVDFAAPVLDEAGQLRGVLGAHVLWSWVGALVRSTLPEAALAGGVEAFVISAEGKVLYPFEAMGTVSLPEALSDGAPFAVQAWSGGEDYLTSTAPVRSEAGKQLGWRVVLRQPVARALEAVTELHRRLLFLGAVVTLLAMGLAYRLATRVSRPVEALAAVARQIERSLDDTPFPEPGPVREVRQLTSALQGMTGRLIARERELQHINATLEETVEARTAQLRQANEELETLARSDALTGLSNRRFANERLRDEFLRYRRSQCAFSILLLDVDHFKRVNDTHGHEVGDQVLQQVAALLRSGARATDFVARFGGEEFLVLLPDTACDGALRVAEKIRAGVAAAEQPVVGRVTVSIGVAVVGADVTREEEVVRQADEALYRAKAAGRNRVALAEGLKGPEG